MVKFLTTTAISHQLEEIIKGSQGGRLLLISPYLKLNPRIKDLLEVQAQRWKTNIYIVYGKTEPRSEETKWLADNFVRTSFREHLHAKCYMNNSYALVTSMNLYEFSQVNNDEMGILVSAEDDPELYREIKDEADHILTQSENRLNVTRIDDIDEPVQASRETRPAGARGKTALPKPGFCLRCASEIPFDLVYPYCQPHYRSWARYKNEEYEEKHCHACGKEHVTSKAKPVCLSCHPKYRSVLRARSSRT